MSFLKAIRLIGKSFPVVMKQKMSSVDCLPRLMSVVVMFQLDVALNLPLGSPCLRTMLMQSSGLLFVSFAEKTE
jgi:hypothetical protein